MFNGMGIQYAGTLLGCVAILLIPISVCFYLYGRKLRERSKYSPTMGDKPPLDEENGMDEEGEGGGGGLRPTNTTTTKGTGVGAGDVDVEKKA